MAGPSVVRLIEDALTNPGVVPVRSVVGFYPSNASVKWEDELGRIKTAGKCLRAQYYSYLQVPETNPPDAVGFMKFALGNSTHDLITELLKKSGSYLGDEVRMFSPGPPPISGRPDNFIKDTRGGKVKPVGVEVKSIYGYYAEKMILGRDGRPKIEHILQCIPYLDFYGQWGLDLWILYYVSRGNAEHGEFFIRMNEQGKAVVQGKDFIEVYNHVSVQSINARWLQLIQYIDKMELPPRDYAIQYDNKTIVAMYEAGEFSKTDTTAIKKKLDKGKKDDCLLKKGDWQCLAPTTGIQFANGSLKNIEDVVVGDRIVGVDGATRVTRIEAKESHKPCVQVKPIGLLPTVCTVDHEWLTVRRDGHYLSTVGFIPEFVRADRLKEMDYTYILRPVHTPSVPPRVLFDNEGALLGYFAAEGHLGNHQKGRYYQVGFTLHAEETRMADRIISLVDSLFDCNHLNKVVYDKRSGHEGWSSRSLVFYSVKFADFIRSHTFGRKARTKQLKPSTMGMPPSGVEAFLVAAEEGDGYFNKQGAQVLATSSRMLAYQYQQLYWRLGIPAIIQVQNSERTFDGYKCYPSYRVQYQGDYHAIRFVNIGDQRFAMTRVRTVTPVEKEETVWDLEVESRFHAFSTESGLVHNCSWCDYRQLCWAQGGWNDDIITQKMSPPFKVVASLEPVSEKKPAVVDNVL